MAISKDTAPTPFTRWQGRFHRNEGGTGSEIITYITRPTFDRLRLVTKDDTEWTIATGIMHAIDVTSTEYAWESYQFENEIVAGSTAGLGGAGMLAMEVKRDRVVGEFERSKQCPVIALHYLDPESYSKLGGSEIKFDSLLDALRDEGLYDADESEEGFTVTPPTRRVPKLSEGVVVPGEFDPEMLKLLPTDLFRKDGISGDTSGREDAIELIKCQLAEVRVANTEGSPSFRQSEVMELLDLGLSPAINLTGRPGTGKTTVAQMAVPEVSLQRGARRGKRRILYLTTTNDLAVEAKKEIENIAEHVYPLGPELTNRLMRNVVIVTRDQLIQDLALDDEQFNFSILKKIVKRTRAKEKELLSEMRGREREDWRILKKTWLEDDEGMHDLSRVLENLVFGLFGSIDRYLGWYKSRIEKGEGREDPEKWYRIFTVNSVNLFEPAYRNEDGAAEGTLLGSGWTPHTGNHEFTLSEFWNPFTESDKSVGRDKIASLKVFLEHPLLGGELFIGGEGYWTNGSVIDRIDEMIEDGEINREMPDGTIRNQSTLWSEANTNAFDAIIIDESQDFTAREISVVLKRFSIRAAETGKTRSSSLDRLPFLFFASGDPLQTIEGSLFNSRNGHINALYDDWRAFLRNHSFDPHHPADNGLTNITHRDLEANHRNSVPIVKKVINSTILRMRDIAKEELGQKREIKIQTTASSRRGIVLKSEEDADISEQIWKMTFDQVVSQINNTLNTLKATETTSKRPTVALILADAEGLDDDSILGAIPDHEKFLPLKEAVTRLLKEAGEGEWRKKVLGDAGLHNIITVKGLTLEAAVSVGFGDNIAASEDKGQYERMRVHSHYLVSSSRPQFALLVWDSDHPEWVESSMDTMEGEDLQKILDRVEVNLEPGIALDQAMAAPLEDLFWTMLKSAINQIRGKERQKKKSEDWRESEDFVDWAHKIHSLYGEGEYRLASEKVREGIASRDSLVRGAENIGRPGLVEDTGGVSGDPLELLHSFLSWRDFVENCSEYKGVPYNPKSEYPYSPWVKENMKPWVRMGSGRDGAKDISELMPNSGKATPFEASEMGGDYVVPRREDCTVPVVVPAGWKFPDMVQANAWSTGHMQLLQILDASVSRTKPADRENLLRLRWFISAAREPRSLWDLISSREISKSTDRRVRVADWLLHCLAEDPDATRFRRAFDHWMTDSEKKRKLYQIFREWLGRDFGDENLNLAKEALGRSRFKEFITSDAPWLQDRIVGFLSTEYENRYTIGGKDRPRFEDYDEEGVLVWTRNKVRPTLELISNSMTNEPKKGSLPSRILHLFEAIQKDASGTVESSRIHWGLRKWLIDDNLKQIAIDTDGGWQKGTISEIAQVLFSIIRRSLAYSSIREDIGSEWFGKSLSSTWDDGWKNRDVEKMVTTLSGISKGDYGDDGPTHSRGRGELWLFNRRMGGTTRTRMEGFLQQVYQDCIRSGGPSNLLWHPGLEYLMYLHADDNPKLREKKDPRLILRKTKKALNERNAGPEVSRFYREGHNFWNGLTVGGHDKEHERIRRTVKGLMRSRDMWREDHLGHGSPIPKEARVPWPSVNSAGKSHQFSNTSPGIIAYIDIASGLSRRKMKDIHWGFRLSGSYREAAVLSVCLALQNRRRVTVAKAVEAVSLGIRNAVLERCGIYMDHVQVDRRWAALASPDKGELRRAQKDPLIKMMTLRLNREEDTIMPSEKSPIGRNMPPAELSRKAPRGGPSKKRARMIDLWMGEREEGIAKLDSLKLLEQPSLVQILLHLEPKAGIESTLPREELKEALVKPADIIESTRRLLPYILFAEEMSPGVNRELAGAQWFSPKDTAAMVDTYDITAPIERRSGVKQYRDDTVIEYSRNELQAMLADEGDSWMLELCDLYRSVREWDSSTLEEFTEQFFLLLKKAPGSLDRMARTLIGDNDETEDTSESEFDALLGGLGPKQRKAFMAWKERHSGT